MQDEFPPWRRHRPPWLASRLHKRRFLFIRFALAFGISLVFFIAAIAAPRPWREPADAWFQTSALAEAILLTVLIFAR